MPDDILSPREREILTQAMRGMSVNETAKTLHIGPGTVRKRRESILQKRGAKNITHAVALDLYATGKITELP